jgi:type II secretory pathway pseudopilin PulG
MRARPVPESGYTLLEMLVLLAISGIVVSVLFQAILGQTGFARVTTAREEVQQNARTSLELITSELRALAPHGVRAADRDSIRFLLPRAWGVLCQGIPSAPVFGVAVTARFPGGTVPEDFGPGLPAWGIAVARGTDPAATPTAYGFFRPTSAVAGGTACDTGLGAAPGTATVAVSAASIFGTPTSFSAGAGLRAYVFEEVGYRASGGSIERMMGYLPGPVPNWKELAGPLDGGDAFEFRYFQVDGTEITSRPLTSAQLPTIASIRVSIRTQSAKRVGATAHQSSSVSTLVHLRNR